MGRRPAPGIDYVIAPKVPLEMHGMTLVQDQLTFYGSGFGLREAHAQYTPPVVQPPDGAEVVEEWTFFYDLARRMGLPLAIGPATATGAPGDPAERVALDMQTRPTTDALFEILTKRGEPSQDPPRITLSLPVAGPLGAARGLCP